MPLALSPHSSLTKWLILKCVCYNKPVYTKSLTFCTKVLSTPFPFHKLVNRPTSNFLTSQNVKIMCICSVPILLTRVGTRQGAGDMALPLPLGKDPNSGNFPLLVGEPYWVLYLHVPFSPAATIFPNSLLVFLSLQSGRFLNKNPQLFSSLTYQ